MSLNCNVAFYAQQRIEVHELVTALESHSYTRLGVFHELSVVNVLSKAGRNYRIHVGGAVQGDLEPSVEDWLQRTGAVSRLIVQFDCEDWDDVILLCRILFLHFKGWIMCGERTYRFYDADSIHLLPQDQMWTQSLEDE